MGNNNKQQILGALVKHGYVHLRTQFYLTWREWLVWMFIKPWRYQYNFDLANLLHRIGENTHTPEFTELDISFLNHAVPRFLAGRGNDWDTGLLMLLVELHDSVPEETKAELTWHPTNAHRAALEEASRKAEQHKIDFLKKLNLPNTQQ